MDPGTASWHLGPDGQWTRHHLGPDGEHLRDLQATVIEQRSSRRTSRRR